MDLSQDLSFMYACMVKLYFLSRYVNQNIEEAYIYVRIENNQKKRTYVLNDWLRTNMMPVIHVFMDLSGNRIHCNWNSKVQYVILPLFS